VGDFDLDAVKQALQAAFGTWNKPNDGALPFVRAPRPFVQAPPLRTQITTPDKQNANMRLVLALPVAELHADFAALMLANELFSGGGGSRLWDRMRERDGLSYGVQSVVQWNAFEDNSRWLVAGIFAPHNLAKMEAALREETARALKDGFTAEEFERQRTGLLQERRLNRAQDAVLANGLLRNLQLGRSFATSQKVDDALAQLTLAQVNAAFRKYIDPAKWALAWAGDFKP
jgi:zinc protease